MTLISVPFETLDDPTAGYPIQDLKGTFQANAWLPDTLYIYSPTDSRYTTFKYVSKETTNGEPETYWAECLADGTTENKPTTKTIPLGSSVYISKFFSGGTVTVSGKISSEKTTEVALISGMNFIANPYPVAVDIKDLTGGFQTNAWLPDQLFLVRPEGGFTKYVYTDLDDSTSGWVKDGEDKITTDSIPVGGGALILKFFNPTTLTFSSPL